MRIEILFVLVLMAPQLTATAPIETRLVPRSQITKTGCGLIKGRVLDGAGHPVAGVKIYSLIMDRPPRGREYSTTTDTQGEFSLTCAELGKNSVYIAKEGDGYPDTLLTPFIDPKSVPIINVTAQSRDEVEVHLPPKAGKLNVRVIDAATGRPIDGAILTLCRASSPFDCHQMNANQTSLGLSQLMPAVPFTIKAAAPGHADQSYSGDMPKGPIIILNLAPGTIKNIEIHLKPLSR